MSWDTPRTASSTITSTHQWKQLRPQILERDGHRCQIRGPRCTGQATVVDKIILPAHGGNPYDPNNLRAACWHCNDQRGRTDAHTSRRTNAGKARHPNTREPHPGAL